MIRRKSNYFLTKKFFLPLKSNLISQFILSKIILVIIICLSCSPAKRFTNDKETKNDAEITEVSKSNSEDSESEFSTSEIRVSMQGLIPSENLTIGSAVNLFNESYSIFIIIKINC